MLNVPSPRLALLLGLAFFIALSAAVSAQEAGVDNQRYVVDIELQTVEEFRLLLDRAEQLLTVGSGFAKGEPKVTFVLHGPVLRNLLRSRYMDNKRLVNLAAALSAMEVIEVKACRTWMRNAGLESQELQPFIETVNYGPAEVRTLVKERDYLYF